MHSPYLQYNMHAYSLLIDIFLLYSVQVKHIGLQDAWICALHDSNCYAYALFANVNETHRNNDQHTILI